MLIKKIVFGIPLVALVVWIIYSGERVFAAFLILVILAMLVEMCKSARGAERGLKLFSACLYLLAMASFALMIAIRLENGPRYVVAIFTVAWGNDALAYGIGQHGSHYFTKVSEKKTLEGLTAGTCASLVAAIVMTCSGYLPLLTSYLIAACAIFLGPTGDLLFSLLKRKLKIKDFSGIIPGHGGALDRFDSIILTAIGVWIILQFV